MSRPGGSRQPGIALGGGGSRGLALTALLLFALNMRGPITALAPVIGSISSDLRLSAAVAGVLTGIPVLCFFAATPLAAAVVTRYGTAFCGALALVALVAGTLLRSAGGFAVAVAGAVVVGLSATIGNVAMPVITARDFTSGITAVTGATTAATSTGAVLMTIGTAPLALLIGWRWALAAWATLAVVAAVVWLRVHGWRPSRADAPGGVAVPPDEVRETVDAAPTAAEAPHVLRRPLTWLLVVVFASQSASYYALTAWLPTILHDSTGMSTTASGSAAALFQGFGVLGALLTPLALSRLHPRLVTLAIAATWLALPLGLLLAPSAWPAWASFGGIAQASNFTVIMAVIATVAGSPAAAGRMSAAVQTVGYAFAALAPSALGALHTSTSSWTAPLVLVVGVLTVMAVVHVVAVGALVRHRAAVASAPALPVAE